MNKVDTIVATLTPGSIFNRKGHVFRSIDVLKKFSGLEEEELFSMLDGDLVQMVTCKPSRRGRRVLVALTEHIPAEDGEQICVAAGPCEPRPCAEPQPHDDNVRLRDENVAVARAEAADKDVNEAI